jgi:hypothetical protein
MNVVMLSSADWAGSGYRVCEAINKYTDHKIELIVQKGNMFGHPRGLVLRYADKQTARNAQKRILAADIVHLKGDWPPEPVYQGMRLPEGKPIIITVSGGKFRRGEHPRELYMKAQVRTSLEPDLLYPWYKGIWTPYAIDSKAQANIWHQADPPIICHSPSDRPAKDTDFLLAVLAKLKKRIKFELLMIEKKTYQQAVEMRKIATIFCDQFKVGAYGNSAVEAMQFGIPTACYLSHFSFVYAKGKLDKCPILTAPKEVDKWVRLFEKTLTNDMGELSKRTKQWADDIHSYQSIAKLWDKIYKSL